MATLNPAINTSIPLHQTQPQVQPASHIKNTDRLSSWHFCGKFAQTILITPFTTTAHLTCRLVKLLTWDICKSGILTVSGRYPKAAAFFNEKYYKTWEVALNLVLIPSVAKSAFWDMVRSNEEFKDTLKAEKPLNYLNPKINPETDISRPVSQFSSYLYGRRSIDVIRLPLIKEFPAKSDAALKTVLASLFLKPDVMAINFGVPNVATFVTEEINGSIQTLKVDAKSLWREDMTYHETNGQIQSGIFFVPTNLPPEGLLRFKEAAKKLADAEKKLKNITCVNTNCRVLKEAGFSIEGKEMNDVVLPMTFMEHLLFRKVFYTDLEGNKQEVHFDIINTTADSLEDHFEKIRMAVVSTRKRHSDRHNDTEDNMEMRSKASRKIMEAQKTLFANLTATQQNDLNFTKRKVTISVPSCLGDRIAQIWGRHTLYEVDLSDEKDTIKDLFKDVEMLPPFPPKEDMSFFTKLKKYFFFSSFVIRFLRRHIMGRVDTLYLNTPDLFNLLKSTKGEHLNYVILENKIVFAKTKANGESEEAHRKVVDWALSKHALLAGRKDVYCSGEVWYEEDENKVGSYNINNDSGTYTPKDEHVKAAAQLAKEIFGKEFKIVKPQAR